MSSPDSQGDGGEFVSVPIVSPAVSDSFFFSPTFRSNLWIPDIVHVNERSGISTSFDVPTSAACPPSTHDARPIGTMSPWIDFILEQFSKRESPIYPVLLQGI